MPGNLSVCLSVYLSACVSVCLCICLHVCLSASVPVGLPTSARSWNSRTEKSRLIEDGFRELTFSLLSSNAVPLELVLPLTFGGFRQQNNRVLSSRLYPDSTDHAQPNRNQRRDPAHAEAKQSRRISATMTA